jgi:hypothetical protein
MDWRLLYFRNQKWYKPPDKWVSYKPIKVGPYKQIIFVVSIQGGKEATVLYGE